MQGYVATIDLEAATGIAMENRQYGDGGLLQIFVPDADVLIDLGYLVPVDNISLY
jgi:toxin YxiD